MKLPVVLVILGLATAAAFGNLAYVKYREGYCKAFIEQLKDTMNFQAGQCIMAHSLPCYHEMMDRAEKSLKDSGCK